MKCRYARMAIFRNEQIDWIAKEQSKEDYIQSALAKNIEFKHGRTKLYYSPRVLKEDLIAGVIEKRAAATLKSGPWENETRIEETFNTANFAIRLTGGQEVALEQENDVYIGDAFNVFRSLGEHINKHKHAWSVYFRRVGSQQSLNEYLERHSGAIQRITIVFERPNADFGPHQALHDDLKESLTRIRSSRKKVTYESDEKNMLPDERVRNEMEFANDGNGEVSISHKDDRRNSSSFQTNQK